MAVEQGSEIGSPAVMERMIDQLADHVGALKQRVDELEAENETLHEELAAKDQRIRELEQRLRQYENPHTPPSRRGGAAPAADTDTADDDTAGGDDTDAASGGTPGRNSGHEGTTRPPPDPDKTVRVEVDVCPECRKPLDDADDVTRRVIVDIPHPQPITVTEYELGHHECPCGTETVATHPECPEEGRFGPNLLAQTALLKYHGRLPHEKLAQFYDWQYDHGMSAGTVYRLTRRVADQLRPAYEQVQTRVREADAVYCDETGFPVGGEQYWVWTFTTDEEVFYTIDESRGSTVLEDVLGEDFAEDATLSCDGWGAYPTFHPKLQRCWAHLLREADDIAEESEQGAEVADQLHTLYDDLKAFLETDPSQEARQEKRGTAYAILQDLVEAEYESERVRKFIGKLENGLGYWLTFLTEPDVEPTNNRAERALREQVILRKILGTLRTEEGTRIHETIMTMIATWEQRGLDPPTELIDILKDHESDPPLETSISEVND